MYSDLLRNLSADEQMGIKDVLFLFSVSTSFCPQEWRAVQDIRKAEILYGRLLKAASNRRGPHFVSLDIVLQVETMAMLTLVLTC